MVSSTWTERVRGRTTVFDVALAAHGSVTGLAYRGLTPSPLADRLLGSRAMRLPRVTLLSLVLCAPSLASCVTVHPYEREFLARPAMDLSGEAGESSFRAHVHDSREGATGGHGSTGGGCGCN